MPWELESGLGWYIFEDYYNYKRYLIKKYLRREEYKNTDMFLELIFSNDILPHLKTQKDLCRVFFGEGTSHNFRRWLSDRNIMYLATLLKARFRVQKWTKADFEWFSHKDIDKDLHPQIFSREIYINSLPGKLIVSSKTPTPHRIFTSQKILNYMESLSGALQDQRRLLRLRNYDECCPRVG